LHPIPHCNTRDTRKKELLHRGGQGGTAHDACDRWSMDVMVNLIENESQLLLPSEFLLYTVVFLAPKNVPQMANTHHHDTIL